MILASDEHSSDSLFVASDHLQTVKAMPVRTKRQFGIGLSYLDEIVGIGVGPGDRPLKCKCAGSLPPTRRIGKEGKNSRFAVVIWNSPWRRVNCPTAWSSRISKRKNVPISGDNCFRSFPNPYVMRGTAYRDVCAWADTMDVLMAFEPEFLDPGHIKPCIGAGAIEELLTDYCDAIRHVVDVAQRHG